MFAHLDNVWTPKHQTPFNIFNIDTHKRLAKVGHPNFETNRNRGNEDTHKNF